MTPQSPTTPAGAATGPLEHLTVAKTAARFRTTSRTVLRWMHRGYLPGYTQVDPSIPTSPYLIPRESVEALEAEWGTAKAKEPKKAKKPGGARRRAPGAITAPGA